MDRVRTDRNHSATFLAREAVRAMTLAARELPHGGEYLRTLDRLAEMLAGARPAMAATKNMVERYAEQVRSAGRKVDLVALEGRLLEEMDRASESASAAAAGLIHDGDVVVTCSYSSTVLHSLRTAREAGKRFRVVVLESRSGDSAHGRNFLRELVSLEIGGWVVPDDTVSDAVRQTDLALVGADKLLPGGSVVNGKPSGALAEAASGVLPFYAVCEEFKRDSDHALEEGFDIINASLITLVVTSAG